LLKVELLTNVTQNLRFVIKKMKTCLFLVM